jgi:hypothetical protein
MGGQELRILDQIRWMQKEGHAAWLLARKDSAIYKEACRMDLPTHPIPFRGSANRVPFGGTAFYQSSWHSTPGLPQRKCRQ